METGCSVSAVRHALHVLEQAQLIRKQGTLWQVRKFIVEQPISSRAKTRKEADRRRIQDQEAQEREAREVARAAEEKKRSEQWKAGKHPFLEYYEGILQRAAAGDPEALKLKETHRATYDTIKQQLQQQ